MSTGTSEEDDFYLILPSNVQSVDRGNTQSQYRTTLSQAISLNNSNRWEVGLVEMTFVNAIKTIHKESISIAKNKPKTPEVVESEEKIITIPKTKTIPYLGRTYNVCAWEVADVDKATELVTCDDFRIVVSSVDLPSYRFHFRIEFLRKDIQYIKLNDNTATLFGFIASDTRTFAEPLLTGFDVKKIYRPEAGERVIEAKYPGRAVPIFEKTGHRVFKNMFYMAMNEVKGTTPTDPQIPYAVGVEQEYDPTPVKICKIPPGYYRTASLLVDAINKMTESYGLQFRHDEPTNRIHSSVLYPYKASVKGGHCYSLDKNLLAILGYESNTKVPGIASLGPVLDRGIYSLFVYCDVCREVRVGNSLVPLLRNVSYTKGNYGDHITMSYDYPLYVPLSRRYIDSIEIKIADDTGEPVPFEEGKAVLTLHFRRT